MERRRTAPRLAGLLACATVPAMLLAGCSPDSGGGSDDKASGTASKTTAAPTLAPARFSTLPGSCKTVTKKTVSALVPKAKSSGGTESETSDIALRGGCSWTGNGSDGYQYRWLSVTLQRFTSSTELGGAEDQAKKRYADEVAELGAVKGFTTTAVAGIGDQASSVSGKATVAKVTSQNDTVVARTGNVVVIVEYNGAGLVGKKNPSASTVNSGAQRAAKDAVASVSSANPANPSDPSDPSNSTDGSGGSGGTSGSTGTPKGTATSSSSDSDGLSG
ncbi:DUF3558 domain-containing protein [Streptomyces sp. NBC_01476]|uniref:DUF3558 domain-containing protein n=1 Tax=Streptomyces sp. NBC_01476 TaxID=2903881 RepID=UPI002E3032CF|nr:DUF3558 domain-containing protein [Streptomyces sp. NBC_01476]